MVFRDNPVVRAAAVESLEAAGAEEALPWIRMALLDDHPGVRFAACMAVGALRDRSAESMVRQRLDDQDASVRAAAVFALHRLGDDSMNARLPAYLLESPDAAVRRNAALIIGRMENPSGLRVLARAMKDGDPGVRQHALEGMARLGNAEARQQLVFMTGSGVGSEEVFAIHALAELRDPAYRDNFRYKLSQGSHPEVRLAAARALGLLGSDEGYAEAIRGLRAGSPRRTNDPRDPPQEQRLRIRQLAALAVAAAGRPGVLPELERMLEAERDPRVRVALAQAILELRHRSRRAAGRAE